MITYKIKTDFVSTLKIRFPEQGDPKFIKILRPKAVLSQMNLGVNGAIGHYSSKMGIPSILISHGSHVLHQEKHERREHEILAKNILYGNYRDYAVQTPLARQMVLTLQKTQRI